LPGVNDTGTQNTTGNAATATSAGTVTGAAQVAITSLGTLTTLRVDNIKIDGNLISSTDTNGNIAITPNGSGEVDISKVDIDGGAIDNTTIGGSTPAAGSFTTLTATSVDVTGWITSSKKKHSDSYIYVSASYDGTVTNGSSSKPYKTIATAITASSDNTTIFIHSGTYTENLLVPSDISICFLGEDKDTTIITGGSLSTNCFYQSSSSSSKIYKWKNLTIKDSLYGIRSKSSSEYLVENCLFKNNGWNGTLAGSENQTGYTALWTSNNTSSGGGLRLQKATNKTTVINCEVEYCLRGLRVEDSDNVIIQDNYSHHNLDSGIYLADSSYAGTYGCSNCFISGNKVEHNKNNGILLIGTQQGQVLNNTVLNNYNSGIQLFFSTEVDISSNVINSNNLKSYNGIGNGGDAYGAIAVSSMSPSPLAYYCIINGNDMSNNLQGSQTSKYAIYVSTNVTGTGSTIYVNNNEVTGDDYMFNNTTPISNNISVIGTLSVTGASTLTGNVTASGNLSVTGTGTFSSTISAVTGSSVGNLTLANGSITDSSGAISFDNENLSTTGTLESGNLSVTGYVGISNSSTESGELRIYEATNNGTNYTSFKVGTQSNDVTYILPTSDGTSGYQLTTNGSGILSWASAGTGGGGGSGVITGVTNGDYNRIATFSGSNTLDGEANLTFDGTNLKLGSTAGSGVDAYFYTAGTAAHVGLQWDADGNTEGMLIGGADGHGIDFKFFGETSGKYIQWDMSGDELVLASSSKLSFHDAAGGENIVASEDGHLEINAGTTLDMTAPTVDINASTAVTIDTPSLTLSSSSASEPILHITNTHDGATSGELRFNKDGASAADDDVIGNITFVSEDDTPGFAGGPVSRTYASIVGTIADMTVNKVGGKLTLNVAKPGGTLTTGLTIEDSIGTGAGLSSLTTIAGNMTVNSTIVASAGISVKNGNTSAGFINFFEDSDNGSNKVTLIGPASISPDLTITLPSANTTLVGTTTTDTLTNKTLTSPTINVGSDAAGDIYYRNGSNAFARLAKGSNDQVLTLASGIPSWADAGGGSSTTINNNADNRIITGSGTADTLEAEANLTFDGSDIKLLSDGAEIHFGANSEIKLIHDQDAGLILKHTATADDKPVKLTLQTGEIDIAADDVIGAIDFQAPDEGTQGASRIVAAGIQAVSEGNFSNSNNATKLVFKTAASEAASEKMSLSSAGNLTVSGTMTATTGIINTTVGGVYMMANTDSTHFNNCLLLRGSNLTTGNLYHANGNVGIGDDAMLAFTSGDYNVVIGYQAGLKMTDSNDNVLLGYLAGGEIVKSYRNICIGKSAGITIAHDAANDNICIGYQSDVSGGYQDGHNQIVIGADATGVGHQYAVIGNAACQRVYMNQNGNGVIYANGTIQSSDSRIKTNIVDIDDSSALQYVRDIPCRYYTYLDTALRGTEQTPGFIAQEVEAVFPLAVSTDTNFIPNEYRLLTNYTLTETTTPINSEDTTQGNYWNLTINDLTDLSTTNKYRIKVSNDTTFDLNSDINKTRDITAIDGNQTSFMIKEQWTHIFLFGKEVTDFKRIDKTKIFTLHHSAIQQIDTTLTAEQAKIASLETELASEKAKVVTLESEVAAIKAHLGM
jgi:parallel beta-helix repeat protein